MNTTVTIHLAHTLFHIDSDAFALLKNYLNKLEKSFAQTEGKQEILEDIEVRIAELFSQYTMREGYVISEKNVNDVIEILGSPEDISEEETQEESTKSYAQKKLYRDTDERIIGGVASGLGHYFGIDRVWIRLILIILVLSSIGGVVFVYILLWALIPEAKTTSEKLRMRGEPVNISNIEKKIKEGLDDVTQKVKSVDYSKVGDDLKKKSIKFSEMLERLILLLVSIASKIIGFFMILFSTIVLIGLLFSVAIFGFISSIEIPPEIIFLTMNTDLPLWAFSLLLLFGVGIPFTFIFVLGLRLLASKRKLMNNSTKYTLGVIWITTLLLISFTIAREFRSNAFTARTTQNELIDMNKKDTLRIRMNTVQYDNEILVFNATHLVNNDEDELNLLLDEIRLNITQSKDDKTQLRIEKKAKGRNQKRARENANAISYPFEYYNKNLLLDSQWLASIAQARNEQQVRLNLEVVEGQYLYIDRDFSYLMYRGIKNDQNYSRRKIAGHLWKMENGTLICHDCPTISGNIDIDNDRLRIKVSDDEADFELSIDEDGLQIKTSDN
ncbi:MAG: PspC domain-containing protein [Flavobacteriaceae bacterium]|nr:PspC domain-containing protein [Flavobacteriaceae bacterium]